jgi:cyanophycinase
MQLFTVYIFRAVALAAFLLSGLGTAWAYTVFAVGGGNSSIAIDAEMVKAVGSGGRLCVIADAADSPEFTANQVFRRFRVQGLVPLIIAPVSVSKENCEGLYIAGGEQKKLVVKFNLNDPQSKVVANLRHAIIEEGVVVMGNSAGTAVLSDPMIVTESNEGPGLGVSPVVLDQHFLARGRLPRLIRLMERSGQTIGVGIDERAAMVFKSQTPWQVLGPGSVVVIERVPEKENSYLLSWLHAGDSYDPQKRQFAPSAERITKPVRLTPTGLFAQQDSTWPKNALVHLLQQIAENKVDGATDFTFTRRVPAQKRASIRRFSFLVTKNTQIFNGKNATDPTIIRLSMSADTPNSKRKK